MANANNAIAPIPSNLARRKFLLTAALGVGSAAVVGADNSTLSAGPPGAAGEESSKTQGYQASAHVRNYYRTARV